MTKLIDRIEGIEKLIDPFGNRWHVVVSNLYPGLFKIALAEGNPNTQPPSKLRGHYTNADRAKVDLRAHLIEAWDKSDEAAAKAAGKRKTPTTEEAA